MPGFTTHYLLGENTVREMPESVERDCLCFHYNAFSLGLQGPDIFFYYLPATTHYDENVGNVIHSNKTREFFRCLINARNNRGTDYEKDVCDAYICGFIGHYTLDSICHPYVYFRSGFEKNPGDGYFGRHVHLETDMDTVLLDYYRGLIPTDFSQYNTIRLEKEDKKIIAALVNDAIHACFPSMKMSKEFVYRAISAVQRETYLMVDPRNWKKKLIRHGEQHFLGYAFISALVPSNHLRFYKDPCNFKKRKWHYCADKSITSNESVFELMDKGQEVLTRRIKLYYEGSADALLEDMGNCSYLTGLEL